MKNSKNNPTEFMGQGTPTTPFTIGRKFTFKAAKGHLHKSSNQRNIIATPMNYNTSASLMYLINISNG